MYPIPSSEHFVKEKKCRQCSTPFPITDKDMEFYLKVSPVFPISPLCKEGAEWNEAGDFVSEVSRRNPLSLDTLGTPPLQRRYTIPPPTLCPDCRQQRRLAWRNERKLYKRKCDATGKDIISIYSPDKPYTVYHQDYWWSDAWNPLDYGREFDFSRGAMEQFGELMSEVPKNNLTGAFDSENSEYAAFAWRMKDCYMVYASWMLENVFFSSRVIIGANTMDVLNGWNVENSYELIDCEWCFACTYCIYTTNCNTSYFLYDCDNCSNCFLCYNLKWKKYCIENIEYSEEEYFQKIWWMMKEYLSGWWGFTKIIKTKAIHKNLLILNSENSIGDNIKNCKDCYSLFHFWDSQNCKYIETGWMNSSYIYDAFWAWENFEFWYELVDSWLNATKTG